GGWGGAGISPPDQRIASCHRISVAVRRDARAGARHGGLSGRMAARPTAARKEFRSMVGRDGGDVAPWPAGTARQGVACAFGDTRYGWARRPEAGGGSGPAGYPKTPRLPPQALTLETR